MLGFNYRLAKSILDTNIRKFARKNLLNDYNDVIKQQLEAGILEPIDLNIVFENKNNYSFISHTGVVRPDHPSTKIRIVFLSNLGQGIKSGKTYTHNQVSYAGPSLNYKLSTALTLAIQI